MKFLALIFLLFTASVSFAHGPGTEEIMGSMMHAQNVSNLESLDCSKISAFQMEFLGDAVMERILGSDDLHEQIDNMMGGEGSESLGRIHFSMGANWIGCNNIIDNMMTSANMMGPMMMRMMGAYYPAYYNGFDLVLVAAIVGWILFMAMLIYHFRPTKSKRRHH